MLDSHDVKQDLGIPICNQEAIIWFDREDVLSGVMNDAMCLVCLRFDWHIGALMRGNFHSILWKQINSVTSSITVWQWYSSYWLSTLWGVITIPFTLCTAFPEGYYQLLNPTTGHRHLMNSKLGHSSFVSTNIETTSSLPTVCTPRQHFKFDSFLASTNCVQWPIPCLTIASS